MEKVEKVKQKNIRFGILLGAMVLIGGSYGTYKYIYGKTHEETEDAQIKSDVTGIIPRVPGYIKQVFVSDNQEVKKGDTLLVLDDNDFQIQLTQAQAGVQIAQSNVALAQAGGITAQSNVLVSHDQVRSVGATMETAKVNVWRTSNDLERYTQLYNKHSITKQQYEQAQAAKQAADAQLKAIQAQQDAAKGQTQVMQNQTNSTERQVDVAKANLLHAQAILKAAELNVSYTHILSPVDGKIARVNLLPGQYVMPGQTLFTIVGSKLWVVGNFKETQLDKMQEGQTVAISIDAYPEFKFEGVVSSISPGTGSEFTLLPPDNASGNFVKVVQRVPVKIEFKNSSDKNMEKLRAGLSAVVEINTK